MSRNRISEDPLGRRLEKRAKAFCLPLACRLIAPAETESSSAADLPDRFRAARRILVVRQDHRLGNMVLITPFLQELRRLAPHAHIAALVDSRFSGVIADSPWIDEEIIQHRKQMIYRPWQHPRHLIRLRRGDWDIAFDLSNPDSFSSHGALVMAAAGAKYRVGFSHPRARYSLNIQVARPEVECHYSLAPLLLLSACGASPELAPMRISPSLFPPPGIQSQSILVNPGGRGNKRWPVEQFESLLKGLIASRKVSPEDIILLGGPAEGERLAVLQQRLGGIASHQLSSLSALVKLLSKARLYIGCDAGPLHVAAAMKIPVLSIFLTSNPLRYAPLGEQSETIILGEKSRHWTRRGESESGFADRLYRKQPVLTIPPPGMHPPAEVEFVKRRALAMLDRGRGGEETR